MMGTSTSWLMRTASAFAQIERSIKAVPVQPGALYPPPRQSSTGWISWQGWDQFEKQAQTDAERDRQNAKTAVTSPWVFADVQAIANEFASAELVVKERKATKLENVDNHELELLWESPNEHMGRSFVSSFWAWSYVLTSKAYLYWVPDTTNTRIEEVWPIPPFMIRPIPDPKEFIRGYAFRSNPSADVLYIPPDYITYSHSVNLFDARDGLAFLVAAMTEINADLAASLWNLNFFDDNNGLPDGFLGVSQDTLDVDLERIRMEIRDFFGGTKRGVAVGRTNDLKYTQFGRSQKDMEFSQGREFASKIIGRTLGFPDGYWSDLANRANAEQARKTMISGAVWPLLVRLAEDMNAKKRGIVQRWYGEDYRVEFKDIRPEDRQLFLQEQAARKDYWLINELREADGKDPLEDVRGLMFVAEINKGAPTPGSEPAEELEEAQAEKDEAAAQEQAAAIEAGETELPPEEETPPIEGEEELPPAEGEELPIKAQSAQERAIFAKLGSAGKLRPKNKAGDRPRSGGGGGGGGSAAGGGGSSGTAVSGGGGSAGTSASSTSTTTQQKAPTKTKSSLGDSLHVSDANDPAVKAHIRDLNKVPPELHDKIKAAGFNGMYVGKGAVPDLDELENLRHVQPRGYQKGMTWKDAPAAYVPGRNIAVVGTLKANSVSPALHEYGHAAGKNLGYDNDKRLIAIHKKLYQQGKLSPYYRQGGPGAEAGRQELFAESFAAVVKNPSAAREKYGDALVDFHEKVVLKGGQAKP